MHKFLSLLLISVCWSEKSYGQSANDNCSDPIIVSCGDTIVYNSEEATFENLVLCPNYRDRGLWYEFTGDGRILTFALTNSNINSVAINLMSESCEGLECHAYGELAFYYSNTYQFQAKQGVRYKVLISSYEYGQMEISVSCTDPAPNDFCSTAQIVDCSNSLVYNAQMASDELQNNCYSGNSKGLWWELPGDGKVWIFTPLSGDIQYAQMSFFNGVCEELVCLNSTFIDLLFPQPFSFLAQKGSTYKLLLTSQQSGTLEIGIDCRDPEDNDLCSGAISLNCGDSLTYTSTYATIDINHVCIGNAERGLWYEIVGNDQIWTLENIGSTLSSISYNVMTGECDQMTCVSNSYLDNYSTFKSSFFARSGITYKISISAYEQGSMNLKVSCKDPVINDNCSGAITLNCGASFVYNSEEATDDLNDPCSGYVSRGLWYEIMGDGKIWTLSSVGGSLTYAAINLFSGTCDQLICISSSSFGYFGGAQFAFLTEENTSYKILIYTYYNGEMQIDVGCTDPAVNDNCDQPIVIDCNSSIMVDFAGGTPETINGCFNTFGHGLWYELEGNDQIWTIRIDEGSPSTAINLSLTTGVCEELICIQSAHINLSGPAKFLFYARAGVTYKLLISNAEPAQVQLNVTCGPPELNDLCDGALDLAGNDTVHYNSSNATSDLDNSCFGAAEKGLWYSIAGNNKRWVFHPFDISLYYYRITLLRGGCESFICEQRFDGYAFGIQDFSFIALEGENYFLNISATDEGTIGFEVNSADIPPNDLCSGAQTVACGDTIHYNPGLHSNSPSFICFGGQNDAYYTLEGDGNIYVFNRVDLDPNFNSGQLVYQVGSGSCAENDMTCISAGSLQDYQEGHIKIETSVGVRYFVNLSTYAPLESFTVDIECFEPVENDVCESATEIFCGSFIDYQPGRAGATDDISCYAQVRNGLWYHFTGTGQDMVLSSTLSGNSNVEVVISTDICGSQQCQYISTLYPGNQFFFGTEDGQQYSLLLHGAYRKASLQLSCVELAENDLCEGAFPIDCGNSFAYNSFNASLDSDLCYGPYTSGLWYTIVGTGQDYLIRSDLSEGVQFTVKGYVGSCDSLICDSYQDGLLGGDHLIRFNTEIDLVYYVLIASEQGRLVETILSLDCVELAANDICAGSDLVNCNEPFVYRSFVADVDNSNCTFLDYGLWYHFTGDGSMRGFTFESSSINSLNAVLYGDECGQSTCISQGVINQNDDLPGFRIQTESGVDYKLNISSFRNNHGAATINMKCIEGAVNDLCEGAILLNCNDEIEYSSQFASNDLLSFDDPYFYQFELGRGLWYEIAGTGEIMHITKQSEEGFLHLLLLKGNCTALDIVRSQTLSDNRDFQFLSEEGEHYYLLLSGTDSFDSSDKGVVLTCVTPLPNNACEDAEVISCDQSSFIYNSTQATSSISTCFGTMSNALWYNFIGTGEIMTIQLNDNSEITSLNIAVMSDSCSQLFCYQSSQIYAGETSAVRIGTEPGRAYFITIGNPSNSGIALFTFGCSPEVSYDYCSTAKTIECGESVEIADSFATSDYTPCSGETPKGLWYYILPREDVMAFRYNGDQGSVSISVVTGECAALQCLSYIYLSPSEPEKLLSTVTRDPLYLLISTLNYQGPSSLSVACFPPVRNDICLSSQPVSCGNTYPLDFSLALPDPESSLCSLDYSFIYPGLWFDFVGDGDVVSISHGELNSQQLLMKLFSGDDCNQLTCIDNFSIDSYNNPYYSFFAEKDVYYYFLVEQPYISNQTISLKIGCSEQYPNDVCSGAYKLLTNYNYRFDAKVYSIDKESCIYNNRFGSWYTHRGKNEAIAFQITNLGTDENMYIYVFSGACGELICESFYVLNNQYPDQNIMFSLDKDYFILIAPDFRSEDGLAEVRTDGIQPPISNGCTCSDSTIIAPFADRPFTERISMAGRNENETWTVTYLDDFKRSASPEGVASGQVLSYDAATVHHYIDITHLDGKGYSLILSGPYPAGDIRNTQFAISNLCKYPKFLLPDYVDGMDCFNAQDTLRLRNLVFIENIHEGSLEIRVDGELKDFLTRSDYEQGAQIVKWTFNADMLLGYGDLVHPGRPYCQMEGERMILGADKSGPGLICYIGLSTALNKQGTVKIWARDFVIDKYDNCTISDNLQYTFSSIPPDQDQDFDLQRQSSFVILSCDDFVNDRAYLNIHIWDKANNYSSCKAFVRISSARHCSQNSIRSSDLSGYIYYKDGAPVVDAAISINCKKSSDVVCDGVTNKEGHFSIEMDKLELPSEMQIRKPKSLGKNISTLDLVLIRQHILNNLKFNLDWQIQAADVNSDGRISLTDMTIIQKSILGFEVEEALFDWRFIQINGGVLNSRNQFNKFQFMRETAFGSNLEFVAIEPGDVEVSSAHLNSGNKKDRLIMKLNRLSDELEFYMNDLNEISGFQTIIDLNGLEIIDAKVGDVGNVNKLHLDRGYLMVSFASMNNFIKSQPLFRLKLKKGYAENKLRGIKIATTDFQSESYSLSFERHDLELLVDISNSMTSFTMYPNPATEYAFISCKLEEDSDLVLKLYNVKGQLIKSLILEGNRGANTLSVDLSGIQAQVLIYEVLSSNTILYKDRLVLVKK